MIWKILGFILVCCIVACTPLGSALAGYLPDGWDGAEMTTETKYVISLVATIIMAMMALRFVTWIMFAMPHRVFGFKFHGRAVIKLVLSPWACGHKGKVIARDWFIFMIWSDIGEKVTDAMTAKALYNKVWGIQPKKRVKKTVKQPQPARRPVLPRPANDDHRIYWHDERKAA